VILNFRTTYVSKSGNVVFNPRLITANYFKSWFSVDLFAAIPGSYLSSFTNSTRWRQTTTKDHLRATFFCLVDLFTIFLEFPDRQSNLRGSLNNVQMLKILRLLRLARIAYKLELLTQYGAVALTVSVLIFGMMAHWLACFWYLIGISELNSDYGIRTGVGWLYELSRSLNVSYQSENHTIINANGIEIPKGVVSYVT